MVKTIKIIFLTMAVHCCLSAELPKPGYARTYLKVSRSLPGTTEEMKVRTTEGNLATLIVKKRNHTSAPANPSYSPQFYKIQTIDAQDAKSQLRPIGQRTSRTLNFEDAFSLQNRPLTLLPQQPLLRTNVGANRMINLNSKYVPQEVTVTTEVGVKTAPKESTIVIDKDGIPVVYGRRVPDDPMDKFQTWRNARVTNNKLVPNHQSPTPIALSLNEKKIEKRHDRISSRQQKNVQTDWNPEQYKIKYQAQDSAERNDEFNHSLESNQQQALKDYKALPYYPSPTTTRQPEMKIVPLSLKTGSRTPVLQYAHPEFGVQPAKITKSGFLDNQLSEAGPKHDAYTFERKNFMKDFDANKYYNYNNYYNYKPSTEPPLWIKLSEDVKNQLHSGMEKVTELTKPIINPIMDVTYKGLNSLGLLRKSYETKKMYDTAAAPGSSILIPALGLVASGAALGLGAVAVGRYLDVEALTRFNTVEKMRSYQPVDVIMYENTDNQDEQTKQFNDEMKSQRKTTGNKNLEVEDLNREPVGSDQVEIVSKELQIDSDKVELEANEKMRQLRLVETKLKN